MAVFVGLDVHKAQITFDALDAETGEVRSGRVRPGNRHAFRLFLQGLGGADLVAAVEAMTGWRFVVEELHRVGAEVRPSFMTFRCEPDRELTAARGVSARGGLPFVSGVRQEADPLVRGARAESGV
jgi:hypothetical protein